MDPICHTLVGATLARTGLETKTRLGTATLIIAANLPDVDVFSYALGPVFPYAFRRGITHGIPAMIVLPVLLATLMLILSRLRAAQSRAPSFRWLLILSAIGIASHPALDWLNNYGMRWFSPLSNAWSYGDTLFIIDLVVWVVLCLGFFAACVLRRKSSQRSRRAAAASIVVLLAYIGMNAGITKTAERVTLAALRNDPPLRLMASPVQLTPFARDIVMEYPTEYRFARVRFRPAAVFAPDRNATPKGDSRLLAKAGQTQAGQWFLEWARFPYVVARDDDGNRNAVVADARYVRDVDAPRWRGFGMIEIDMR